MQILSSMGPLMRSSTSCMPTALLRQPYNLSYPDPHVQGRFQLTGLAASAQEVLVVRLPDLQSLITTHSQQSPSTNM